jgi:hypothetical protein
MNEMKASKLGIMKEIKTIRESIASEIKTNRQGDVMSKTKINRGGGG